MVFLIVDFLFAYYEITLSNLFLVMAAASLANIVKSSLGPLGLDKMLVDDIGVCQFDPAVQIKSL